MRNRVRLPEIWKEVMGVEVSSQGRVRKDGVILKEYKNNWDYCYVYVGPARQIGVHVLVCLAFHGPKPSPKAEVNHDNGHKDQNWAGNVYWSTRSENMKHAYSNGLHAQKKGDKNPDAKEYVFLSPKGKKTRVKGLRQFCRENNLDAGHMIKIHSGINNSHKGWKGGLLL